MFPDTEILDLQPPANLMVIEQATETLGFEMPSVRETGALLRLLAASKPGSKLLEMGTGTGLATCWMLDGMDRSSKLITLDNDAQIQAVARQNLEGDNRLTIVTQDGAEYLDQSPQSSFDMIFADAWPGKFSHLNQALSLLADDGIYVVDDLLPQSNWPDNHAPRVQLFIETMRSKAWLDVEYRKWSSGILIAHKRHQVS